jgi:hypothetical protein
MGGGMTPEVMGAQIDTRQLARFFDHHLTLSSKI